MTFEKYFKMRIITEAFSRRDVQMAGVLVGWVNQCGFSTEEFLLYATLFPTFDELTKAGLFNRENSVEQSKIIRELERRLPPRVRREVRRVRFANMKTGYISRRT